MKLTCPTKNRLREFLEGSVSDADTDQISDHVEGCSGCDRVLSNLESEQSDLLKELREGIRTESLLQEPEFEQLRNTVRFSQADTTAPANVDEPSETGKRLRDYRLVKKIGEGGMGTVYQAVHVHLAKHVALKILPADKLRSGQSVKRFRQEMRAVGKVNHPNVVSASDAGTIDGQHFLVMELVQGADLARIIHDRGPLSVADACEIVRQAAIGLQHAHDNGLVHRDVKPSNIMLALDGSVRLLDLGLAGLNNSEFEPTANVVVTDRLTSVGQIMGTLDYMAPEQITASPQVDGKADIYALGATLFQLLTGRTPCGDRSEGTSERIEAVLHKPPLEIARLRSDVPEELRALLLKMLAKNPQDRPRAVVDVASELKHFTPDSDLVALAEECRTSLDMPSADVDVTDDVSFVVSRNTQPQDEGNSRRPFRAVVLAGFFLALVAAVVYYIQTNNGVVLVEVNNPSLKVAINDQTITMTEGNKKPLTISAGEQSLVVRHEDFEFETNRFQIRRGDKIAFKVELLDGEVVVSKDSANFGRKAITLRKEAEAPMSNIADYEPDADQRQKAAVLDKGKLLSSSEAALLEIKEQNRHLVHIQELDCPLPASWQYRIYIPREKSGPLFRLVTGVCEDRAFADDKLSVKASVPVPLAREQFVLNITIRRASDGEYKCYAYIVGPKNADFHEIALPAVENLKLLTDPREKYFETGKRVMARGTRHQEVKLYQPRAAIPLVLLKTSERSAGEDSAKAAASFPAIWLRLKMPAALKDSSTAIHGDHLKSLRESLATSQELSDKQQLRKTLERSPQLREKLARKAEELGNKWLAERLRSDPKEDDGEDCLALANRLAKEEQWDSGCDAFLEAFRSDPNLFGAYFSRRSSTGTQIGCFQKAGRLIELAQFFDATTLQRRRTYKTYGMDDLVIRLTEDRSPETRLAGYELLERVFQHRESVADSLLRGYSYKRFWKSVPDPVFLLRCWLIPKDIEKRGWDPFSLAAFDQDEGSYSNRLTKARPLLVDPKALQQFADELRQQLQKHPKWMGGWAMLALFEGEIGNYREAAQLVRNHILTGDPETIPRVGLWSLGDFLHGKDSELDGIAVKLWELAVRDYATTPPHGGTLRVSPINVLARAYAEDKRDREARQLLYGLVDPVNQHPLVKGYAGNKSGCGLGRECITCHSNGRETIEATAFGGFYDVIKMSDAMTDIGYPIDALLELARTDATFRNAFSSSRGWVDTSSEKGKYFEGRLSNRKFSIGFEYDKQASKARSAVTPRKVIEALETDTFYRSSLRDEAIVSEALSLIRNAAGGDEKNKALRELARTSQERENKGSFALDLMLSVRGEGPHAQATVFSPVIDIFKLAVESKESDAAKDIAELDKRLVTLSEQHPKSIETRIAATVFAFFRKDLDSAKDRLKQLQFITNYPESDGAAFWLVARHALQHDQTRLLGAVFSERALTAAEVQPDSRLKEAILRERTSIRSK